MSRKTRPLTSKAGKQRKEDMVYGEWIFTTTKKNPTLARLEEEPGITFRDAIISHTRPSATRALTLAA